MITEDRVEAARRLAADPDVSAAVTKREVVELEGEAAKLARQWEIPWAPVRWQPIYQRVRDVRAVVQRIEFEKFKREQVAG